MEAFNAGLRDEFDERPDSFDYPQGLDHSDAMAPPRPSGELDRPEFDTLNESVFKTIGRDLWSIVIKLSHVIVPCRGRRELQDWDLWGPLLLSLVLAVILTISSGDSDETEIFSGVFVIVWLGSTVVTINALLLGGKVSFFQTVCALGYCLGPLDIAAAACMFWDNTYFRVGVVSVCFVWSIVASWSFVKAMMPVEKSGKTALVIYPVVLFYLVIAWLIVMMHDIAH
eukprot:TRINITY_DN1094_c0_g1_i1.p1 TRINITY_DN1094_c0_g1~~TRINITY_DN1094_c0_g1_i1.p1  ORF type:complete len:227 (-),score=27.29 TRINITY_DN1094_c0_g1_i1:95-775(-)